MFVTYNNFRRYCDGNEIKEYKKFYKEFSNKVEFGGALTNYDCLIRDRFADIFGYVYSAILRKQPKKILDLGCGNGVNLPFSRIFPWISYFGLDYADVTVRRAKTEFPLVKFAIADAFSTCFKDESFDFVILASILLLYKERQDQVALLREVRRMMKKDAVLTLVVWNEAPLLKKSIQLSRFFANLSGKNSLKDFMCVYFFSKDIVKLAKLSGFHIDEKVFTGENFGVLESVRYLNLSKYNRKYGKAELESKESHPQNILKDLINRTGERSRFLTAFMFALSKVCPGWFSNFSIYFLTKN